METSNSPLLAKLVDTSVTPGEGKVEFLSALSQLGITSVLDIVELPKAQFIENLAELNDDDGALAYDRALSFATQLQWLGDQQPLAFSPGLKRSEREVKAVTSSVLDEDWGNFCAPDALAAIDSPVAYLRALYLFATQLEKNGKGSQKKILLSERRPDLQTLQIDHDTTFGQRPLLSIMEEVLREQLRRHHPAQELHSLLSAQHYPLALPYHHHHHQCRLGLAGTQYSLGELNYRISKRLPLNEVDSAAYADVLAHNPDTQSLLSELNPEQQKLLTQARPDDVQLLKTHYGWARTARDSKASFPTRIEDFLRCTGLDSTQLQALLAQNRFAPHTSPSAKGQASATFGARYINAGARAPITVAVIGNVATLENASGQQFDRLHRMIRLQKWFGLTFCELDTLIVSAMACEGRANAEWQINQNTLRALGVYRYLNRRYNLSPLEFCAWLHRVPVQANAKEQPLFDQVFNRTSVSGQPLALDGQLFDAPTRQQVCAALALTDTPDSLQLLLEAAPQPARRDLATYSSLYRQARIAQVFGLSVQHCKQLAELLDPAAWARLSAPALRAKGTASVDFLAVLMQLDWAATWLKDRTISVPQLRQQLLLDPVVDNPALSRWIDVLQDPPYKLLSSEQLSALNLPQPAAGEGLPHVEWTSVFAQVFMPPRDLAQSRDATTALRRAIDALTLSKLPEQDRRLKDQAWEALLSKLKSVSSAYAAERLRQLLEDSIPARYTQELFLTYYHTLFQRPSSAVQLPAPKHLVLLIPDIASLLPLPVSGTSLRQLLLYPRWLDGTLSLNALVELNLSTLYLLQRFRDFCDTCGVAQEKLLEYFQHANNHNNQNGEQPQRLNARLSHWLGWNEQELQALIATLPAGMVRSMDQLDWVMRCRNACTLTRLSSQTLLDASALNTGSDFNQWKSLGEAVIAARQ